MLKNLVTPNSILKTAVFIGNHSELLFYLQTWIQHEGIINAIISESVEVIKWGKEHNVPVFSYPVIQQTLEEKQSHTGSQVDQFLERLGLEARVDYLFSIFNYTILPPYVLDIAKLAPINYHAAPIKEYGGVYGTSWAIIEDKKNYSISWHRMYPGVDGFNDTQLVESEEITISNEVTAFELEAECNRLAQETFRYKVLDRLAIFYDKKQYHSSQVIKKLYDKPHYNAFIDTEHSVAQIKRLWRALQLSADFPNYLSLFKISINNTLVYPQQFMAYSNDEKEEKCEKISARCNDANEIIELSIRVRDGIIKLRDLKTLSNTPLRQTTQTLSLDQFSDYSSFVLGHAHPGQKTNIYHHEKYWVNKLSANTFSQKLLTFDLLTEVHDPAWLQFNAALSVSRQSDKMKLLSLFYYYFHTFTQAETFVIGYADEEIQSNTTPESRFYYSDILPLSVALAINEVDIQAISQKIETEITSLKKHITYAKDVVLRYPKLRFCSNEFDVNVYISNDTVQYKNNSKINIIITDSGYQLLVNLSAIREEDRNDLKNAIAKLHELVQHHYGTGTLKLAHIQSNASKMPFALKENIYDHIIRGTDSSTPFAIVSSDQVLKRDMFIERVEKISQQLQKMQIIRQPLLIYLKCPIDSIVAIFAALKAGCTYIPISSQIAQSCSKFEYIIKNTQAEYIITESALQNNIREYSKMCSPLFFTDLMKLQGNIDIKKSFPLGSSAANHLAYIVYTSGSSGTSKGVAVSHSNIVFSTLAREKYYYSSDNPASFEILPLTNPSFDATIGIMFWALKIGARLLLPTEQEYVDSLFQLELLLKSRVTHLIATPQQYVNLLQSIKERKYAAQQIEKHLKVVILGGDVWPDKLVVMHQELFPTVKLYNEYGPTECTVWTTSMLIYSKDHLENRITLGYPIEGVELFITNSAGQLMPDGIAGELCISGPNVTLGYRNDARQTEERFITDEMRQTYFKTGDIVRRTHDGNLFFIGRNNNEIKFNGLRVDIAAIEHDLKNQSALLFKEVVILKALHADILYLFVITNDNSYVNSSYEKLRLQVTLSTQINSMLPSFVRPFSLILLNEFPMLPSGKIDRVKLLSLSKDKFSLFSKEIDGYVSQLRKLYRNVINLSSSVEIKLEDHPRYFGLTSLKYQTAKSHLVEEFKISETDANLVLSQANIAEQSAFLYYLSEKKKTTVLILGATGYLGTQLLYDLIESEEEYNIICLVRKGFNEKALAPHERLQNNFRKLNLILTQYYKFERVQYYFGDTVQDNLGLNNANYEALCRSADVIYDFAAEVNHLKSDIPDNVTSAENVIALAKAGKKDNLAIHYVSTLSIHDEKQQSGYVKSKRKVELLYEETAKENNKINVHVYRPGWISFNNQGYFLNNDKDHLICLIKSCLLLRSYPKVNTFVPLVFVYTLTDLLRKNMSIGSDAIQFYNDFNIPISWLTLMELINECVADPHEKMHAIDPEKWRKLIVEKGKEFPIRLFYDCYVGANSMGLLSETHYPPLTFATSDKLYDAWKVYYKKSIERTLPEKMIEIFRFGTLQDIRSFLKNIKYYIKGTEYADESDLINDIQKNTKLSEVTKLIRDINKEEYSAIEMIIRNKTIDDVNDDERHNLILDLIDKYHANFDALNCYGTSPVYEATVRQFERIVTLLIKKKAKLNIYAYADDFSPLMVASYFSHMNIFNLIYTQLKAEGTLDEVIAHPSKMGDICLHFAIQAGKPEIVRILAKHFVAKVVVDIDPYNRTNFASHPMLHYAASLGHEKILEVLLEEFKESPHFNKLLIQFNPNDKHARLFVGFVLFSQHYQGGGFINYRDSLLKKYFEKMCREFQDQYGSDIYESYQVLLMYEEYYISAEQALVVQYGSPRFFQQDMVHSAALKKLYETDDDYNSEEKLMRKLTSLIPDKSGRIPFHYCVILGHFYLIREVIGYLQKMGETEKLQKLINFPVKDFSETSFHFDDVGNTPLHFALTDHCNLYIRSKISHYAKYLNLVIYPSYRIASLLLECGAQLDVKNKEKITPCYLLSVSGVYTPSYYTQQNLMEVCADSPELLDFLLTYKSTPVQTLDRMCALSQKQYTLLTVSCFRNFYNIAAYLVNKFNELISAGYKPTDSRFSQLEDFVNFSNQWGMNALYYAVRHKNYHLTKFLLDNGARVDIPNNFNKQVLHLAVEKLRDEPDIQLIRLLIARGADVTALKIHSRSPEDFLNAAAVHLREKLKEILSTTKKGQSIYQLEEKISQETHFELTKNPATSVSSPVQSYFSPASLTSAFFSMSNVLNTTQTIIGATADGELSARYNRYVENPSLRFLIKTGATLFGGYLGSLGYHLAVQQSGEKGSDKKTPSPSNNK